MKQFDSLAEHLSYFGDLGVDGVSRDRSWRVRGEGGLAEEEVSVVERVRLDPSVNIATSAVTASETNELSLLDQVVASASGTAAERLGLVRDTLGECTRCKLHPTRITLVFGVGNPEAKLMFVGEAPGRDEDRQGIPFVGRAGQLLNKIIESIDLRREDVYIANVIKCRPPDNRNPAPDEVRTCEPFLFAQIDIIQPRVIVALGAFATRTLLRTDDAISKVRGHVFDYRGATLIPTYHPAFLLRSPDRKRDVWEDMKKVRAILRTRS